MKQYRQSSTNRRNADRAENETQAALSTPVSVCLAWNTDRKTEAFGPGRQKDSPIMLGLQETVLCPGRPSGALGGGKLEGSREACEAGGAWEDCRLLWDSRAFLSLLVPSFVPMCHQRTQPQS